MKAVVYRGPGALRVEEIPLPEPGPGELLVRVDVCGICPTDVKKIERGLLAGPRVFGHEIAGTVVGLGPGTCRWREGQRVVVHHHVPCGHCSTAPGGPTRSARSTRGTARPRASSPRAAATRST